MRSAHIIYRSLTLPADAYEGTDGVLIIRARNEDHELTVIGLLATLLVLLTAFTAAC